MLQQPTYQAYQSVKVTDPTHTRAGQVGHVVDVNERVKTVKVDQVQRVEKIRQADDGKGGTVDVPYLDEQTVSVDVPVVVVGVRFDADSTIDDVPVTALSGI